MTNTLKRHYCVAIVEDSNEDVFLIQEASRQVPHDIHFIRFATAESAISGLTAPDVLPLDGIMVDLNLPRGSGLDVIDAVRRSDKLRNTPVVVLTSSVSARDRAAAQALDIRAYIEKPTQLDDFEQAVMGALDKLLAA
ncbi:MAG: response regulator [Bryobacteraceae bacterium]|jgi:CheY-like chemotaxis protein